MLTAIWMMPKFAPPTFEVNLKIIEILFNFVNYSKENISVSYFSQIAMDKNDFDIGVLENIDGEQDLTLNSQTNDTNVSFSDSDYVDSTTINNTNIYRVPEGHDSSLLDHRADDDIIGRSISRGPPPCPPPSASPSTSLSFLYGDIDEVPIMGTDHALSRPEAQMVNLSKEESGSIGIPTGLCHPESGFHRAIALFLMCILGFGSYFCYDNPGALQVSYIDFGIFRKHKTWFYHLFVLLCSILIFDRKLFLSQNTC